MLAADLRRSWLLLAAGESRQHGGNTGYDDQADIYYSWDSTVANHESVAVGDAIAIWDKTRLLGVSIIETIEKSEAQKLLHKCPRCGKAGIKARKKMKPRYKCYKCDHLFDEPTSILTHVTEYRSRHDAAWRDLDGLLTGSELRALCASPKSQQSLRPLRWDLFESVVAERGGRRALDTVRRRTPDFVFPGGHVLTTVRVRRGQQAFRDHLLGAYGDFCAFTGHAPLKVLEAGHLYSYADLGVHHAHGGLLLRRDVHRLFDDGSLAVKPGELTIDVAPDLEPYSQYSRLHGRALMVTPTTKQLLWLSQHWRQHRAA